MASKKERMSYDGLTIEKGKRHSKIVDEDGEVAFRTTNLRDARKYLRLLKERDQLQQLLESRGIAPHRIYLLAADEEKRGKVNLEGAPASEVVIVAKTDDGGLVVRHLEDGKEEIVDPEELEPIEGGSYLRASEVQDETMHVLMRVQRVYDEEGEQTKAHVALYRSEEMADEVADFWEGDVEFPGSEYEASLESSERDVLVYRADIIVED